MFFSILGFFIGFYILIKGADFLVKGASNLAYKLKVSPIVVGLLIAGIGSSIPEFATSFISNLLGHNEIALGTVVGSNIFNMLFILGICAIASPLFLKPIWINRDLFFNFVAIFISLFFMITGHKISRFEGLLMLAVFIYWLYLVFKNKREDFQEEKQWQFVGLPLVILMIIGGLIGVIFGGELVTKGAEVIARELNMSESFVGLIIVGIGTSLPEFIISFVAALKKQIGLSLGNIIGSNIFDFLMILGVSAVFQPISVSSYFIFQTIVALFSAIFVYGASNAGEKFWIKKQEGILMVLIYLFYLVYVYNLG